MFSQDEAVAHPPSRCEHAANIHIIDWGLNDRRARTSAALGCTCSLRHRNDIVTFSRTGAREALIQTRTHGSSFPFPLDRKRTFWNGLWRMNLVGHGKRPSSSKTSLGPVQILGSQTISARRPYASRHAPTFVVDPTAYKDLTYNPTDWSPVSKFYFNTVRNGYFFNWSQQ